MLSPASEQCWMGVLSVSGFSQIPPQPSVCTSPCTHAAPDYGARAAPVAVLLCSLMGYLKKESGSHYFFIQKPLQLGALIMCFFSECIISFWVKWQTLLKPYMLFFFSFPCKHYSCFKVQRTPKGVLNVYFFVCVHYVLGEDNAWRWCISHNAFMYFKHQEHHARILFKIIIGFTH